MTHDLNVANVVACIDPSPYADAVSDYAIWAAQQLQAPLTVLHAIDKAQHTQTPDLSGSIGLGSQELLLQQLAELDEAHSQLALARGRALLEAAKTRALQANLQHINEVLRHGSLLDTLKQHGSAAIRLLVLGKRGYSSAEAHGQLGLHVEQVIRSIEAPILLTQQRYKTPQRIMLAYDGSATAEQSLQRLAASPLCRGLPVHLVFASGKAEASNEQLNDAAKRLIAAGFTTKIAIVEGEPAQVLNQYQQEHHIDLLVMGAYGHSRLRQFFLGSTTTAMLRHAKCSLLILR